MTPKQFAEKYWNLEVPFEDGSVTVRVDRYLSGCHSSDLLRKAQTLVEKKDSPLTVRVRTIRGMLDSRTYDWTTRKTLTGVLQDPFTGKGSPEEVQVLLQVAVSCGFLRKAELAAFCQSGQIGLDCCGFVSNYVWHAVMGKPWDLDTGKKDLEASNYIPAMMMSGRAIKTEEDFVSCRGQCLVFATADPITGIVIKNGPGAHVMITEPHSLIHMASTTSVASKKGHDTLVVDGQSVAVKTKTTSANTCLVVESTGGGKGLVCSRYRVLAVDEKTGVFWMQRGCSTGTLRVRVATLGVK